MGSEANLTGGETHDGVSQTAQPIPRDLPPARETSAQTDASGPGTIPGGAETDGSEPAANTDTANSAGGIAPSDNADDTGNIGENSAARGLVPGINEAAGPAEEQDRQQPDERGLTTDISPSD
jgi:hypothetical protein